MSDRRRVIAAIGRNYLRLGHLLSPLFLCSMNQAMLNTIDTAVAPPANARVRAALLRVAVSVAPPTNVAVAVAAAVVAGVSGAYPPAQSPARD